jgi:hypothetical protein
MGNRMGGKSTITRKGDDREPGGKKGTATKWKESEGRLALK